MSDQIVVMREFWMGMLTHLWQATLILVPLFLVAKWIRHAPARVTHAIWTAGFIKLFLPLVFLGGLSRLAIDLIPHAAAPAHSQGTPAVVSFVSTVLVAPETGLSESVFGAGLGWVFAAITAAWIVGVLFFLVRVSFQIRAARHLGRTPEASLYRADRAKFQRTLKELDIPADRVRVCEVSMMPAVVGFLRPLILIPKELVSRLAEEELCAILLHEDTHRRRLDPLQRLVRTVGAAFFFFYPLVWPVLRRLDESTEFVCDERALRAGFDHRSYARALSLTLRMGLMPAAATSLAGYGGASVLGKRLERLKMSGRSVMTKKYYAIIIAVTLLVAVGSFWPIQMTAVDNAVAGEKDKKETGEKEIKEFLVVDEVGVGNAQMADITDAKLAPRIIKYDPPKYPELARARLAEGTATLKMLINTEGRVDSMTVKVESDEELQKPFEEAIIATRESWLFEPAKDDDGKAVSTWVQTKIKFRMNGACDDTPPPPPKKGKTSVDSSDQPKK